MAKYKTTITEKDGTTKSGYIENGKSYYDNGKEINVGASVTDSTGKTWTKGGTTTSSTPSYNQTWESGGRTYVGGVDVGAAGTKVDTSNTSTMINSAIKSNNSGSGSSSYKQNYGDLSTEEVGYNPYEEYANYYKQAYQDLEDKIKEQNRLAVEQGTNRLNAQKDTINQAAEDNARQAYIMQMQAKKALPQQLAGQGGTGGTTETANLGIQTTYQNNINDINKNKVNAIQEIDNAIADLKTTGDLSTVEQVLANNQQALETYKAMLDKGVSYNQWANQYNASRADNAYNQAYKEREYADMLKQQALENEMWQKEYSSEQKKYQDTLNQKNQQLSNERKQQLTNIFDTAFAMYKAEDYTPEDVKAYVLSNVSLTDEEQYEILKNLGLL